MSSIIYGQTDKILIAIPRLHFMQRGKNQLSSSNSGETCCIDYIRGRAYSRSLHYAGLDVMLSGCGTVEPCTVTVTSEEIDEPIVDLVG